MDLEGIQKWIGGAGAFIGLVTLAIAVWRGVWRGLRRPPGRTTGLAGRVLQAPLQLVFGFCWIGLCVVLWRPLPVVLPMAIRTAALVLGPLLYFPGLALYLWAVRALGDMYKPSSGFGVSLSVDHQLVREGPFAIVRHPMYLGLQMAAWGGLLLYWTWTMGFVALNFVGLFLRARREEQALAAEFGAQWEAYRCQVPAWIPRIRR